MELHCHCHGRSSGSCWQSAPPSSVVDIAMVGVMQFASCIGEASSCCVIVVIILAVGLFAIIAHPTTARRQQAQQHQGRHLA